MTIQQSAAAETTSLDTSHSQVSVTSTEILLTLPLTVNPLTHSIALSDIIPSQTTTALEASFSQRIVLPSPTIPTASNAAILSVTNTDFFTPGTVTPSQATAEAATEVITASVMPSPIPLSHMPTTSHDLESKSIAPTPTETMGYLTVLSSAIITTKSLTPFTSSLTSSAGPTTEMEDTGRGNGGRGILSNLGDAPLWVWVTMALVVLVFISCCIILCLVAACITNREAKQRQQARNNLRGSTRMSMVYGVVEEGRRQSNRKKTKNKTKEEMEKDKSTVSRWDNLRVSWNRSQRTVSTFKPHSSPNKQVTISSTNGSDTTSCSTFISDSLVIPNSHGHPRQYAPSSHQLPSCISTSSNAYKNPLFGMDTQNNVGKGYENIEPYCLMRPVIHFPERVLDTER